ncbi:MAG: SDR family oxidoreductase [Hydrogenophaga sp.]|uniref:SDR family oxidoreductase n=1 Tax=Hydrogenophaga sp. TaxID=1904254 RepID=UPI00271C4EA0|nr:SDR family oxidoreductase [Hydrogenophaga sp.]MDO9147955.1 SDR family oxidoreductase [Hydrogenophaga sp.]MDP2165774.1 SDR family oxidoreductase [Hydrogenophaga sp.]MDP3474578.1 SDR family oxidoreductase [Hydrogenophaga sp.]
MKDNTPARAGYRSAFAPGLLAQRVVVVTGGGSGIGRCTAHELASLGAHVVLIGRSLAKLQDTAGEIVSDGGRASFHRCDIRQEDAVRTVVTAIVAAHGRIDGLVNNAGGQYITPLENISAKGWQAVIDTNLTGGFLMARECYVQSMQAHGGAIVNIVADMWGSMPGMGHSGAARAGMVSFTETAALEWARSGVRVNAVAPGYIASSGMDHYPPEAGDMLREMRDTVPAGRFGNEAETAAAIVFLLSPAASFISGSVLRVDGARPQVRMGWGQAAAPLDVQQRDAVKPFEGFHRYVTPKVFQP